MWPVMVEVVCGDVPLARWYPETENPAREFRRLEMPEWFNGTHEEWRAWLELVAPTLMTRLARLDARGAVYIRLGIMPELVNR